MSRLTIETADGRTDFFAGEELRGRVAWDLNATIDAVELRLFWYTRGKGTVDTSVVEVARFEQPMQRDEREFSFTLPDAPYSFSGKLISLIWSLELVVEPTDEVERLDITITPTGREIRIG